MTTPRYPACILGTCCVPWTGDGRFDEPRFRRHVRFLLQQTWHLYIFGTAGEGYAVTEAQFDAVVAAFCEEMRQAGAEPMVGVIHLSLPTILERIARARDMGIRQFQVSLPSWGVCDDAEVDRFFEAVCGGFPDCRFLHYNLLRTKRLLSAIDYARLATRHPNLVATKNTGDSLLNLYALFAEAPQLQHFLSEFGFAATAAMGQSPGLLISLATVNWQKARAFFEAGAQHRADDLWRDVGAFRLVLRLLMDAAGRDHIDGVYDKLLASVHEPDFPLQLLPPYTHATPDQRDRFHASLVAQCAEWFPR